MRHFCQLRRNCSLASFRLASRPFVVIPSFGAQNHRSSGRLCLSSCPRTGDSRRGGRPQRSCSRANPDSPWIMAQQNGALGPSRALDLEGRSGSRCKPQLRRVHWQRFGLSGLPHQPARQQTTPTAISKSLKGHLRGNSSRALRLERTGMRAGIVARLRIPRVRHRRVHNPGDRNACGDHTYQSHAAHRRVQGRLEREVWRLVSRSRYARA